MTAARIKKAFVMGAAAAWYSITATAQVPFEQAAVRDLASPDANVRLRAAQRLKEAAPPEAAVPLSAVVTDPQDDVQFAAIAAEVNIFLADKIVPRKRVGLVIEVRNKIAADAAFSAGPLAIGPRPVPIEVLTALRTAVRDDNPQVGLEALYAFGALAVEAGGNRRRELLRSAGPDLASLIGAADPALRLAAVRVIGRLFLKRPQDQPIDPGVGDAVVSALNDNDRGVKSAAMAALGAMRYERAVQALTDLFQHYGRGDLGTGAFDALARIAHPSSAALFSAQLAGRNALLKGMAIEGMGRLGDRSKAADVEAALEGERNDGVVLAGRFALIALESLPIDPLTEALAQPRQRDQARQYLVEIAPGRSAAFNRQAQDPDARLRIDVADILGLGGDEAALAIVERMANDREPQVERAAERAVARLRASRPAT
jgi:HEAT repeat protein